LAPLFANRTYVDVPKVLTPLFADRTKAIEFLETGLLPNNISPSVLAALRSFAYNNASISPVPAVPPGYFGLLRRVLAGEQVPDFSDPFLPLISSRLGNSPIIGPNIGQITLRDLLIHNTNIPEDSMDMDLSATAKSEPSGGLATFDTWGYLKLLLGRDYKRNNPESTQYRNAHFTILSAIIETCTGTTFDDYVTNRLFSDERFNRIRRRVVDQGREAYYYTVNQGEDGRRLGDYTNWPGNGGFYATANQLTDWLHALYTGEMLHGMNGDAPLISSAGLNVLFGMVGYFSLGITNRGGQMAASNRYQHNGSTCANGCMNGNLAIVVAPSGVVFTALYVANGDVPADDGFNKVIDALTWV
jgi:hypothetical protein